MSVRFVPNPVSRPLPQPPAYLPAIPECAPSLGEPAPNPLLAELPAASLASLAAKRNPFPEPHSHAGYHSPETRPSYPPATSRTDRPLPRSLWTIDRRQQVPILAAELFQKAVSKRSSSSSFFSLFNPPLAKKEVHKSFSCCHCAGNAAPRSAHPLACRPKVAPSAG